MQVGVCNELGGARIIGRMRVTADPWLVLALFTPAAALAQAAPNDPRVAAYLALGLAGDADYTIGDFSGSNSLDPTVGFGVRGELALHDYFVVGGSFELLTFEWDASGAEREEVFNFDVLLRARYALELSNTMWIEPYVALPVGLTLAVIPGGNDDVWPGFNIGALAGAYLVLGELPLAFFFELGWRHHQVFNEGTGLLGGDVDLKIVTNQFAMQLGAALRLD